MPEKERRESKRRAAAAKNSYRRLGHIQQVPRRQQHSVQRYICGTAYAA